MSNPISRRTMLKGSAMAATASVFGIGSLMQIGQAFAQTAAPTAAAITDVDILNYALTLEHLEYAFYRDGLKSFSGAHDFDFLLQFGDKPSTLALTNLGLIRDHEKQHVATLTSTISSLGGKPVAEAKYDFGYTDVYGFIKTAAALENTGVSAYTGAIAAIVKPELRTAGATIATVEARHAAYLNLLNGAVPFPASFDTPKTMAEILKIAGPFIVSA